MCIESQRSKHQNRNKEKKNDTTHKPKKKKKQQQQQQTQHWNELGGSRPMRCVRDTRRPRTALFSWCCVLNDFYFICKAIGTKNYLLSDRYEKKPLMIFILFLKWQIRKKPLKCVKFIWLMLCIYMTFILFLKWLLYNTFKMR
jgi:hypothetical protein